ncbi:hypothetical protein LG634_24695 [Streptomyces bambusae]|uniref:hypothetical protein n=1 Tax=Streptomyces bambusae TaxID=1550616 RepID=UPI001CFDD144|nr:hypothetical protein [Streptomyces bambusae]MCB5168013.1 hypothetical protein [Streptomyces bambusae]
MRTHATTTALAAATLLTLTACGSGEPADGVEATIMCEKFVKQRLKSPGSANFSGASDTSVTAISSSAPWKYQVMGHVDSDNSFGASIRNTYDCTASTPDGETWTLDNLSLSGN